MSAMQTPEDRYLNDALYHAIVDSLRAAMRGGIGHRDIRDATELAMRMHNEDERRVQAMTRPWLKPAPTGGTGDGP